MCGGGKGVQQTSQQTAFPSWPAAAAYTTAMDKISQATSQPFQKYSSDPNAYVAPLTSTQTGAIQNVTGLQGMTQPYYQTAGAMTLAGASPVGRLTSGQIQEYMNPYMAQVVDPVQNALRQQFGMQLSQQQAEAIRGGAFGGDRSGLQRQALRGQQGLALGQALSPLYQTGYGQALQTAQGQQGIEGANLQRMLGAGAQLGGLGTAAQQAALQQASAQLQAGTLQQQTETAQKQALYNEFQKQRMYPLQTAQLYAQAAGALGPLMGSTSMGYQQMPFFGGFAADGGAINGYDQGLGAARMGGAVDEPGDYSRGGYAYGGDAGFEDIVSQQRAGIMPQMEDVQFPTSEIRPSQQLRAELPEARTSGGLGSILTKGAELGKLGLQVREARKSHPESWTDALGSVVTGKYAYGGDVEDNAMSDLLSHPIQVTKPQQTQQAPQQQKSGLSNLLKAGAGLAANYFLPGSGPLVSGGLSALGMADGGRAKYATEGGVRPTYDPELDYMARTMVKEAGDQGDTGMAAVGHVGMNRLLSGRYGKTLQDVFTAPKQFSPWNPEMRGTKADPRMIDPESASYQHAYDIARRVREGEIEDPTGGATHFYAQKLVSPKWARGVDPTAVIGGHTFLRADAGADQAALGKALPDIPKGDPRRELVAEYPPRPTTGAPGPSTGLGSAQVREKGFMERIQENPEGLIIPVLQGLGAMAGSKNRYALGALAEGLGAGASSYMDVQKQKAEMLKNTLGIMSERFSPMMSGGYWDKVLGRPVTAQERIATVSEMTPGLGSFVGSTEAPISGEPSATSVPTQPIAGVVPRETASSVAPTPSDKAVTTAKELPLTAKSAEDIAIEEASNNPKVAESYRKSEAADAKVAQLERSLGMTDPSLQPAIVREIELNKQLAQQYKQEGDNLRNILVGPKLKQIEQQSAAKIEEEAAPGIEEKKLTSAELSKVYSEDQAAARTANANIADIQRARELLKSGKFYTGMGGETARDALKTAALAQIPGAKESAAAADYFYNITQKMILAAAGGSLGQGISNADTKVLSSTKPGLGMEYDANMNILNAVEKLENRKKEVAKFQNDFMKTHNGKLTPEYYDKLQIWAEAHPLFTERERNALLGGVTSVQQLPQSADQMIKGARYQVGEDIFTWNGSKLVKE